MAKVIRKIEDETPLIPWVIADKVVVEVYELLKGDASAMKEFDNGFSGRLNDLLCKRADKVYSVNKRFRKQMHSNECRGILTMFMRHWASGYVQRELSFAACEKLGYDYRRGVYNK